MDHDDAPLTLNIMVYMVWLLWGCLSLTPAKLKNPIYARIIATSVILQKFLSDSLLEFAPGLQNVFQASTPPTVAFFKSLPSYTVKCWVVYLLVLEKTSSRPKICIGSATDTVRGAVSRLKEYDTHHHLPRYVKEALDDGYIIVHKGLLCWSPIPIARKILIVRALFIVIEAHLLSRSLGDVSSVKILWHAFSLSLGP